MSRIVVASAAAGLLLVAGANLASADDASVGSLLNKYSTEPWAPDSRYDKQEVSYSTGEQPGTIVIATQSKFLYFVEGNGKAIRYGIGVGRSGFAWSGTEKITRKAEWPDWRPTAELRRRDFTAPEFMPGGKGNPLGARALYLGNTLYRIHGTAQPYTIGWSVSSGCIRLTNENIIDLYNRVSIGTKVVVE
jgi:lipoprotein-anchoring transpeptidase ErfK/SrfK